MITLEALARKGVDARPADFELNLRRADAVEQGAHARPDALGLTRVLAVPPAADGIGTAVIDRLQRAATPG